MSKMSTFDRMCRLREWLKEQDPRITEAAIERKMGVATNYFKTRANASIEEGEKSVREKTLNNLKAAWPEVNIEWVKTGEGSMFEEDHPVIVEGKGIPYYDVDFLGGFDEMENEQTIIPTYFIDFPPYNKRGVICVNLTGDSMSPRINSGDRIFMQPIERVEDIIFGEIYAIVTLSGLRTVKWITRSPESDKIRLIPENKDPRYGDYQDLPKSDIRRIFKVLGAVRAF